MLETGASRTCYAQHRPGLAVIRASHVHAATIASISASDIPSANSCSPLLPSSTWCDRCLWMGQPLSEQPARSHLFRRKMHSESLRAPRLTAFLQESVFPRSQCWPHMAPQPLWPDAGTIGANWNGPHGIARACFCRLLPTCPADRLLAPGLVGELPAGPAAEELAAPWPAAGIASSSCEREQEAEPHSASEMSCAPGAASGPWPLPLPCRLPGALFFLFFCAARPWASFAAFAALWICFISSADCLKACLLSSLRSTIRKLANSAPRSPTVRRNKTQSEASRASAWQNSMSERKDCRENTAGGLCIRKTKGQWRPLWASRVSNWSITTSHGGLRTLKATTTCFCCRVWREHHCSTSGWAERSRFTGSCTLTAVTKSSWISRKACTSASCKELWHPPKGQTENKVSLASGRSSSLSIRDLCSWSNVFKIQQGIYM